MGFAQAEGARAVQGTVELSSGGVAVGPPVDTNTIPATEVATRLPQGVYQLKGRIRDSNGLVTDDFTANFQIEYLAPMAPTITAAYLPDSGMVQIEVDFPDPDSEHAPAVSFDLTRRIGDVTETLAENWPIQGLAVVDATPILNGDGPCGANVYQVTAWSEEQAATTTELVFDPGEHTWFFVSTGDDWYDFIKFMGNPSLGGDASLESELATLAGRKRPVAQFGEHATEKATGTITLGRGLGSTSLEILAFNKRAHVVCYRGPEPRRLFGIWKGPTSTETQLKAALSFTVTESEPD